MNLVYLRSWNITIDMQSRASSSEIPVPLWRLKYCSWSHWKEAKIEAKTSDKVAKMARKGGLLLSLEISWGRIRVYVSSSIWKKYSESTSFIWLCKSPKDRYGCSMTRLGILLAKAWAQLWELRKVLRRWSTLTQRLGIPCLGLRVARVASRHDWIWN